MLPARRRWWHTSPRTSLERQPTRSRRHVRPLRKTNVRVPDGSSVDGSANSSPMRSASWSWMISGYCSLTRQIRMNIVRATADWIAHSSSELTALLAPAGRRCPALTSQRVTRVQGVNQRLRQPHEEVMASGTGTSHAAIERRQRSAHRIWLLSFPRSPT